MKKIIGRLFFFIFTTFIIAMTLSCLSFATQPTPSVNLTGNWNDNLQGGSVLIVTQQGNKITARLLVDLTKQERGVFYGQVTSPDTVFLDLKHTIHSTGKPTPCCAGKIIDNNTIKWINGSVWTRRIGGDIAPGAAGRDVPVIVDTFKPPITGRSYTSRPLPPGEHANMTGQWVFSYGQTKLPLTLTQTGNSIQGQTAPMYNVPIALSGSISGNNMELFLTFTETHYAAFSKNPNLARAIGNITPKATFNVGTNPNMLSGTFYPEYADWRKDAAGNYTIVKKYERGETHASKPPQPCTLTRTAR